MTFAARNKPYILAPIVVGAAAIATAIWFRVGLIGVFVPFTKTYAITNGHADIRKYLDETMKAAMLKPEMYNIDSSSTLTGLETSDCGVKLALTRNDRRDFKDVHMYISDKKLRVEIWNAK